MKILLIILFGWPILLNGSTFAAMQGGVAIDLGVTGSALIPYVPWISLLAYIVAVILIMRDQKIWRRLAIFAAVTVLCNTVIGYPIWIYNQYVHRITLASEPSKEFRSAFQSHFKVKTVWYSNSSEGDVLAVSVADFSEEMTSYINVAEQGASSDR